LSFARYCELGEKPLPGGGHASLDHQVEARVQLASEAVREGRDGGVAESGALGGRAQVLGESGGRGARDREHRVLAPQSNTDGQSDEGAYL